MFCPKCGTQNPDGSDFCSSCGASFARPQQASSAADVTAADHSASAVLAARGASRNMLDFRKLIVALAVVAVIVIVFLMFFFGCSGGNLAQGTYSVKVSSDETYSMTIDEENNAILKYEYSSSRDNTSRIVSGTIEKVGSKDGNNVYLIKNLKNQDGTYATADDLNRITWFNNVPSKDTIEGIYVVIPAGYEKGDIEGRWGLGVLLKNQAGLSEFAGVVYETGSGNTLYRDRIWMSEDLSNNGTTEKIDPIALMSTKVNLAKLDKEDICGSYIYKAPGQYEFKPSDYYDRMATLSFPVK